MKRGGLMIAMLAVMLPVHAGEFWSKLWRNADQRGEALLQKGDAKSAAGEYADPARKAYAKLKAGDFQGAAKDLATVQGSDAAYNRGNALAYGGDLQGALDAYDAALKAEPDNQDAKHNRELVAQQLKQQKNSAPQNNGDQSSADKQQGDQLGQNSGGQNRQGQQSGQADQDKEGKSGQGKQANQDKDAKSGSSAGDGKNIQYNHNDIKNQQDAAQGGAGAQAQGQQSPNKQSASGTQQKQESAKDEAEQARRDAEASLGQVNQDEQNNGDEKNKGGEKLGASTSNGVVPPKTENQLAQEQWLRSIPDDPAGLLRRKFMIEHLIRQQKAQQ